MQVCSLVSSAKRYSPDSTQLLPGHRTCSFISHLNSPGSMQPADAVFGTQNYSNTQAFTVSPGTHLLLGRENARVSKVSCLGKQRRSIIRAVPEIILGGGPHFFFRPLHPQDTHGVRAPWPPGHVSVFINPAPLRIKYALTPMTSYPPSLGHVVNKTPSPHRTKKCLQPPARIISGTTLIQRSRGSNPRSLACTSRTLPVSHDVSPPMYTLFCQVYVINLHIMASKLCKVGVPRRMFVACWIHLLLATENYIIIIP